MADATQTVPATDQITAVDVIRIEILPLSSMVHYVLQETWQSGRQTIRENVTKQPDFNACVASFCQATPKKKFLNYLVSAGYETNLTVS